MLKAELLKSTYAKLIFFISKWKIFYKGHRLTVVYPCVVARLKFECCLFGYRPGVAFSRGRPNKNCTVTIVGWAGMGKAKVNMLPRRVDYRHSVFEGGWYEYRVQHT